MQQTRTATRFRLITGFYHRSSAPWRKKAIQVRAKGVSRIAHHTMEEAEKKELISNMIKISCFAIMSLPEFF